VEEAAALCDILRLNADPYPFVLPAQQEIPPVPSQDCEQPGWCQWSVEDAGYRIFRCHINMANSCCRAGRQTAGCRKPMQRTTWRVNC